MPKIKVASNVSVPGQALLSNGRREKLAVRQLVRSKEGPAPHHHPVTEKSVTQLGDLEEFMNDAELANRDFEVDRDAKVFQVSESTGVLVQLDDEDNGEEEEGDAGGGTDHTDDLICTMPRRPNWEGVRPQELDGLEKAAFLEWRRALAKQELLAERRGFLPSPFEKNLNFWRQLWRVMERSHVLVQVVDARNPLLFRFLDLERYARQLHPGKRLLLLVNKADLLTEKQRALWAEYFTAHDLSFVFFSAKLVQEALEAGTASLSAATPTDVRGREDLLALLTKETELAALACSVPTGVCGMVGYPNVGKSSVINALLGVRQVDHLAMRVSVSATPGHTKHFQTMQIGDRLSLCDCPGLVFPSFFASKAEMLCNGILPIDEIRGRDYIPAIEYLCARVPRAAMEQEYKMHVAEPQSHVFVRDAEKLLDAFCTLRGFHTQGPGRLDIARGSRLLLKDFVGGRLLYCHLPPGSEEGDPRENVQQHDQEEFLVTEAADLATQIIPIETEDEVLFEMQRELEKEAARSHVSRRLANHGRKHNKARNKTPYDEPSSFVAKQKGKNGRDGMDFTRKTGF